MYSQQLSDRIDNYGFHYHFHADYNQLYKSIKIMLCDVLPTLNRCLEINSSWMGSNKLNLNTGKTEVQFISKTIISKHIMFLVIDMCGQSRLLLQKKPFKILGVIIDSTMPFDQHISNIIKSRYSELRLDFCYSLLAGLPENKITESSKPCS